MKKVSFTEMKNGTKDDYQLLEKLESQYERKTADRILDYLASQTTTLEGYQITRLEHSLQAATRAYKNLSIVWASVVSKDINDTILLPALVSL